MSGFVFIIVLFGLHFLSFPCQGGIYRPREGHTVIAEPGQNVTIRWSFRTAGTVFARIWTFESSDGRPTEILATIFGNENPVINKIGLPGVEIKDSATLVLRNVDLRYNGTYIFNLGASGGGTNVSYVKLLVVERVFPVPGDYTFVVSQRKDARIHWKLDSRAMRYPRHLAWYYRSSDGGPSELLARMFHGNDPWIKNSSLPGVEIEKPATLVLKNVNIGYNGTYLFRSRGRYGRSHVTLFVAGPLNMTVCFSPITVNETTNVECMCKAERDNTPEPPSVAWYDKDGNRIGGVGEREKELKLTNVSRNHAGKYICKAESYGLKQGRSFQINVNSTAPTLSSTATESEISNEANMNGAGTAWYIFFGILVLGLITGVLVSYVLVYCRRRFRNRKSPQKPSDPQPSNNTSIYQDLDLTKMKSEDNYQSLMRGNNVRNEAGPRDDESHYENAS